MKVEKKFLWFWLYTTKGIGKKTLHTLQNSLIQVSSDKEIIEEIKNSNLKKREQIITTLLNSREEAIKRYEILLNKNINIIYLSHPLYPRNLLKILEKEAPPVLFIKGNVDLLKTKSIAIIGSRHAGPKSLQIAQEISSQLVDKGFNIISGYAKGIDTYAHLGALKKGGSTTIVLAEGILNFKLKSKFPKSMTNILVLSEFAPNTKWQRYLAMERNKTICGLSVAIIVVSAKEKGGTMNAALFALKKKIPLFIVSPTYIDYPSEGNNILLSKGATSLDPKKISKIFS